MKGIGHWGALLGDCILTLAFVSSALPGYPEVSSLFGPNTLATVIFGLASGTKQWLEVTSETLDLA